MPPGGPGHWTGQSPTGRDREREDKGQRRNGGRNRDQMNIHQQQPLSYLIDLFSYFLIHITKYVSYSLMKDQVGLKLVALNSE